MLSVANLRAQVDPVTGGIVLAILIVDGIKDGCDNLRESGDLQLRCKNKDCVQVACISFRKSCDTPDDCRNNPEGGSEN
ncbi:hypothetical protein [Nitritalea halalkaliphila]|uniref:hypothetical protein n=1 Tax=Nitritalea halalkaliphila TaxID=590849 RepID=UPI00138A5AF3|nr:hypothetical protein [Nitritalea halalkaliphila]